MFFLNYKIPQEIANKIIEIERHRPAVDDRNITKFYQYFDRYTGNGIENEIAVITVAVKFKKWYKNGDLERKSVLKIACIKFLKNNALAIVSKCLYFTMLGGYNVEWSHADEGINNRIIPNAKYYRIGDGKNYFKIYTRAIVNPEFLQETEYKYLDWEISIHHGMDIVSFLELATVFPNIELLQKLGLPFKYYTSRMILSKCKNKLFCNFLVKNKQKLTEGRLYDIQAITCSFANKKSFEYNQAFLDFKKSTRNLFGFKELIDDKKRIKIIGYLAEKSEISIYSYNDYLEAVFFLKQCKNNKYGIDLNDTKVLKPKNFKYWHDMRIDQMANEKAKEADKANRKINFKLKAVAKKYSYLEFNDNNYSVLIAKTKGQLIREGNSLHHCVGRMNYDDRMIREESLILFLRKSTEINKPFVTIEYSIKNNRFLQIYGYKDNTPSEDVLLFLNNKYKGYIDNQSKIQKDKAVA